MAQWPQARCLHACAEDWKVLGKQYRDSAQACLACPRSFADIVTRLTWIDARSYGDAKRRVRVCMLNMYEACAYS